MLFLSTFLGCDEMSVCMTPNRTINITHIEMTNGDFNDLYATHNIEEPSTYTDVIPDTWDFDTILRAHYDSDALAGNINWSLSTVSDLTIKMKRSDQFDWITLENKPIVTLEDFNITGVTTLPTNGKYDFAVVPYLNDAAADNYSRTSIDIKMSKVVLVDSSGIFTTLATDGFCDETIHVPVAFQELLKSKYPVSVRNTQAAYKTVAVTGKFFPMEDEEGNCSTTAAQDPVARMTYNEKLMEFLMNGKIKYIKNLDGRAYLGCIETDWTNNATDDLYYSREISFNLTETADRYKESDLYDAGLISSDEKYWNA